MVTISVYGSIWSDPLNVTLDIAVVEPIVESLDSEAMIKNRNPTQRDNLSSCSSRKGLIWHQDIKNTISKIQPQR